MVHHGHLWQLKNCLCLAQKETGKEVPLTYPSHFESNLMLLTGTPVSVQGVGICVYIFFFYTATYWYCVKLEGQRGVATEMGN